MRIFKIGKWVFLLAIFMLVVFPAQKSYALKSTCDFRHRECFTEAGYIACFKKIDTEKYYEFLDSGQAELANQLRDDFRRCKVLRANKKAFMMEKGGGYVKFGIRGENLTYWAKSEALFSRSQ